jgi:LmbE family N-acetylglucosaminyl deacetylase
MTKRILSIHAHPDDAEILAGGTLNLLAANGHKITLVTMTPGDCGSAELPPEEISVVRRNEARHAAAMLGAEYLCLEFRDLAVFSDDASRRRVVELLRIVRPDLILTASPIDYMADHEAASMLVRDACFGAPVKNFVTGVAQPAPPIPTIPHLYFMDPLGGVDRDGGPVRPDFVVNVESVFEEKKMMLARHKSQRGWLLKHHGVDDYLDTMERWTRERGRQAGLEFGEGFRRYKGHPYPQSPLLEELLGVDRVVRASENR